MVVITMKILLIGASGTLGRAVAAELGARHDIITAGRKTGDVRIDLADKASIAAALARLAPLDAVVSTAGNVAWGPLLELTDSDWMVGVSDKLLGQINVARVAAGHLRDGGSITLTSGRIDVARAQLIRGPGSALFTISGDGTDRIFNQNAAFPLALYGMTIRNGYSNSFGGGSLPVRISFVVPMRISSPGLSASVDLTFWPLRKVPLELLRSRSWTPPLTCTMTAWARLARLSSRTTRLDECRPIVTGVESSSTLSTFARPWMSSVKSAMALRLLVICLVGRGS